MKPEIDIKDDASVAKLLASPVGRLSFVAVGGLLIFDAVTKLRAVVEMTEAWRRNVVEPARQRTLEELRAANDIEQEKLYAQMACRRFHPDEACRPGENHPMTENVAAQIDVDAPAAEPAGDPSPESVRTSWGAEIPTVEPTKVRDNPQA